MQIITDPNHKRKYKNPEENTSKLIQQYIKNTSKKGLRNSRRRAQHLLTESTTFKYQEIAARIFDIFYNTFVILKTTTTLSGQPRNTSQCC